MGAEILGSTIIELRKFERVDLRDIPLREIVKGVLSTPVVIEGKGDKLKLRGRETGVDNQSFRFILHQGIVFSPQNVNTAEIGEGQRFVSISQDGVVRVFEGREDGFVELNNRGGVAVEYKSGNGAVTGGLIVRGFMGEWR